ncbi:MAG: Dihydropteroate synthase [Ignavibacteria bacterium]|nr:MAG: Dihydropteroate synthase [Ignavibacteria bacterium]KAF0162068.1 MAG: Dihydropteroate synthase [Ignavibacteria bacterium]
MTVHIIELFFADVFKRFSVKYNIFRNLYEKDILGLEIRGLNYRFSKSIKKIILNNKEICYTTAVNQTDKCELLVLGSYSVFKELAKEIIAIGNEDLGRKITHTINNIIGYNELEIQIGGKKFSLNNSYIFGILNVTPDSFSDGGKYFSVERAATKGIELLNDGADILDIGGESSRPGAESISDEEELNRVIPVINEILKLKPEALISVDTSKSKVAEEALKAGAKIINDINGFNNDLQILEVVKKYNASYVLMHIKGEPKSMQINPTYNEVVSEIYDYLINKADQAKKVGVKNIIIDPGIGFGKRVIDNYEIIKRLQEFRGIGYPILVGLSKKSFLGKALNLQIDEREDPTLIAETIAIKNCARFIRTHNVKKTKYAVELNKFFESPELLENV